MRTESRHSPVGLTHDAGWELGAHRTLEAPPEEVWRMLLTEWLPQWLEVDTVPQMVGAPLRHGDRVRGRVIGCHMGRRVRVRWTPSRLDHETVFQVTLQPEPEGGRGTVLAVHQERLLGPAERQALLEHWETALDRVAATV